MRRRDATDHSFQHCRRARWPALVSFTLSLGVHVTLCGVVTLAVQPRGRTQVIRVALRSGGVPGGVPDAASAERPNTAVPEPAAAPAVVPVERHQRRAAKASRILSRRPAAVSHPVIQAAVAGAGPESVRDGAAADTGAGQGADNGSGAGTDPGVGTGFGSGDGDGSSQRAYCVYCPEPRYPLIARARGWQGTVHVGLSVQADGTVESANVNRSSGYGVLDHAALAVAKQSRFSPPATRGLPAPLRAGIEYRFQLSEKQGEEW